MNERAKPSRVESRKKGWTEKNDVEVKVVICRKGRGVFIVTGLGDSTDSVLTPTGKKANLGRHADELCKAVLRSPFQACTAVSMYSSLDRAQNLARIV
jgi:hypothetical protein